MLDGRRQYYQDYAAVHHVHDSTEQWSRVRLAVCVWVGEWGWGRGGHSLNETSHILSPSSSSSKPEAVVEGSV